MAEKIKKHKNALHGLPFGPLRKLETDEPVTDQQVAVLLDATPGGVSLLVRSTTTRKIVVDTFSTFGEYKSPEK